MTPTIMRLFWDLVNQVHPTALTSMDDDGLCQWLVSRVRERSSLDPHQQSDLTDYIASRIPLIRDIATGNC